MQPLRIGIDFDGVLADHTSHKLRLAAERGFVLEPWQANSNVMRGFLSAPAYEEVRELLYGDLTLEAPPVAGALEALEKLPGELFVITARKRPSLPALAWMQRYGVSERIPAEKVFFCGNKETKDAVCRELGIELFIDDQIKLLRLLAPGIVKVLLDPDSVVERVGMTEGIRVVTRWAEFLAVAQELAAERV